MKTRVLALVFALFGFGISRAAPAVTWEYANLNDFDSGVANGLRWASPSGKTLEGYNTQKLEEEMKKTGEIASAANADNLTALLQDLGREGWELVQVDKQREGYNHSDTYYFKRQRSGR
jgi:hypothetical protein